MKRARVSLSHLPALALVALAWASAASGQEAPVASAPAAVRTQRIETPAASAAAWMPVGDDQLDTMRGGFDSGGLLASFGIERMVYVNGDLVTQTSVNIPDIGRITAAQASALAAATATISLVQNGSGNTFAPAMLNHATAATVIQNSLDNQSIRSLTTINASVNNLSQFQSARLADSLQAALIGSLGH